jgi:hypothetical protein
VTVAAVEAQHQHHPLTKAAAVQVDIAATVAPPERPVVALFQPQVLVVAAAAAVVVPITTSPMRVVGVLGF